MFKMMDFLNWIGFSDWADKFIVNSSGTEWTFADLVFESIPAVLQLFAIVWLLNWIMGFIFDVSREVGGRRR